MIGILCAAFSLIAFFGAFIMILQMIEMALTSNKKSEIAFGYF